MQELNCESSIKYLSANVLCFISLSFYFGSILQDLCDLITIISRAIYVDDILVDVMLLFIYVD